MLGIINNSSDEEIRSLIDEFQADPHSFCSKLDDSMLWEDAMTQEAITAGGTQGGFMTNFIGIVEAFASNDTDERIANRLRIMVAGMFAGGFPPHDIRRAVEDIAEIRERMRDNEFLSIAGSNIVLRKEIVHNIVRSMSHRTDKMIISDDNKRKLDEVIAVLNSELFKCGESDEYEINVEFGEWPLTELKIVVNIHYGLATSVESVKRMFDVVGTRFDSGLVTVIGTNKDEGIVATIILGGVLEWQET